MGGWEADADIPQGIELRYDAGFIERYKAAQVTECEQDGVVARLVAMSAEASAPTPLASLSIYMTIPAKYGSYEGRIEIGTLWLESAFKSSDFGYRQLLFPHAWPSPEEYGPGGQPA